MGEAQASRTHSKFFRGASTIDTCLARNVPRKEALKGVDAEAVMLLASVSYAGQCPVLCAKRREGCAER
jgi:hypothetical protein